ncbi:MAG: hypothetical protein KDH19_16790 [Geminicoccaceae bacterium]|nr:hypothetical protein [Geminicoccaceae bacterium]
MLMSPRSAPGRGEMGNRGPKVEIILPDGTALDPVRRRRGAFRPYAPGDGRPAGDACPGELRPVTDAPAERRRRRRGAGDVPRGTVVDLES